MTNSNFINAIKAGQRILVEFENLFRFGPANKQVSLLISMFSGECRNAGDLLDYFFDPFWNNFLHYDKIETSIRRI